MKTANFSSFAQKLLKNKYVILVLLLGLVLILIPSSSSSGAEAAQTAQSESQTLESTGGSLYTESEKIALILEEIEGVGDTKVLLSREGAVIVCEGASSAQVRLNVTNAVSSYTGLGSDKITVMKMK